MKRGTKKREVVTQSGQEGRNVRVEVWHKKTCSKSCEVITVLKKKKIEPEVFLYSETPPTEKQLRDVLKKLGMKAEELIRKKEKIYHEKFEGKKMTEEKWIKAMLKYPILIERPIIIKGNKAIIGRPTELILELIK
ncbi:MAG: arsenate reductase family protein [Bacteroidetes bacterium]|nr:arsenate reductase family protein [Bacteroidota bacterium]